MSSSTTTDKEKKFSLEYLGHDVLVNGVFPYLSEKDIEALSKVSPLLKQYTEDPAVWHDLYFKTYGTHPNPFTVYNWPEVYRWRSAAKLYTWGSALNGRLGYLPSDPKIPDSFKSRSPGFQTLIGICRPYPVESLSDISISDIVTGGYWNAVLSSDGKIYGIGELHDRPKIPISNSQRQEFNRLFERPHRDPMADQGNGPFHFRVGGVFRNIFPFRVGGVIGRTEEETGSRLGSAARGNFPFTPHRPRIDNHRPPATTTSAENNDQNQSELTNVQDHITQPPDDAPATEQFDNTADWSFSQPQNIEDMRDIEREAQRRAEEREKDPDGEIDYNSKCMNKERVKELETLSENPIKFISLGGGGRTQLLALDSNHGIWAWDSLFCAPGTKLDFKFTDSSFELLNKTASSGENNNTDENKSNDQSYLDKPLKVSKLACGWNCCAALLENIGLTIWYGFDNLQKVPETKKERREWAKEEKSTEVYPILVPNTNFPPSSPYSIVDFHAGDKFIVYVTKEGKLYKVSTESRDTILNNPRRELTDFYEKLEKVIAETPNRDVDKYSDTRFTKPKFVKVRGGYKYLAAMTDTDNVVCGDMNTGQLQAPAELQNAGCISIAAGDYHILALLKGGNLYSWGCEPQGCGALGHGQFDNELSALGARKVNRDYILDTPKKVETPGKVLVIAAGGWHSAAVITTEDIKDDE